VEENLRVRFPDRFATGWLGTFIDEIRNAPAGDVLAGMKRLAFSYTEWTMLDSPFPIDLIWGDCPIGSAGPKK
jgi:hypothetical protein